MTDSFTEKEEDEEVRFKYRKPEGRSAKPQSYRFSTESLQPIPVQEGNSFDIKNHEGMDENDESSLGTAEQVLHDVGMMLNGRNTENQVTFVHNPRRKVQNTVHHRKARSYQPYEEHRLYNLYHDHMDHMGRIVPNNRNVQFVVPPPQYQTNTYQANRPTSHNHQHRQRRLFSSLLKMDGLRSPFKNVGRNYDQKRFKQQSRYEPEEVVRRQDGPVATEHPQFWPVDTYNEHEMDNLEITDMNYDERRHKLPERHTMIEPRKHSRNMYEPNDEQRHERTYNHNRAQHQVHHPQRRVNINKDQERKKGFYYHFESPDHPARSPKDEYYYGRHKDRPSDIPPNMYIYGEGPVHPVEVPKELQEYDPNENKEEVYPVDKEFDSPQDGRQEKEPFVKERGFGPEPFRGAFPGIPKDPALRRFRLRSGWVIEIIAGGFRAIKDERTENGWRHVYARIYREAPDGSAGRSIWMFQSEYEPPEDDHSPPPEYLQHVTNTNSNRPRRRHKRHVSLMSQHSQHWFTSHLSSFSTSGSPANREELDEIYGEPVAKPRMGGRIPFVKNVDPETIKSPHREPVEGRSIHTDGPNFRPRNGPPVRLGHMNPDSGNNKRYDNRNGGFPHRDSHAAPHRNRNPMNGGGGFNGFRRPQMNQFVRNNNMQSPRLPMRSPPHAKPQTQEQKPAPGDQFMTDQDIFDKVSIPKHAPKKIQPKAEKPPVAKSDFMSDSDIFDELPKITIPTKKVVEAKQAQEIEKPQQNKEGKEEEPSQEDIEKEGYPENGGVFADPDDAPVCLQFPETGPCKAYIRRWYYDPRKTECFTFIFGGCEGNKNSFETKEECMKTCAESDKGKKQTMSSKFYMTTRL